jgi:hypothetical protein
MTELLKELSKVLDAWKAVSPGVGQLRGVKDFRLPDEEWASAMRAAILVMAKLQALGRGDLKEKLAVAKGVMSELYAGSCETPLLEETYVVRKADGQGVLRGVRREAEGKCGRRLVEFAGVRETQ